MGSPIDTPKAAAQRKLQNVRARDVFGMLGLKANERQFVAYVLEGRTATSAAKMAGIGYDSVGALLRRPEISRAIHEANKQLEKQINMGREDIVAGIMQSIQSADTAGEQIKGWREVGLLLGLYAPEKHEHIVRPETATERELRGMSDAQLAAHLDRNVIEGEFSEVAESGDAEG